MIQCVHVSTALMCLHSERDLSKPGTPNKIPELKNENVVVTLLGEM